MAVATDELSLLERVFLRLGSAETDDQLQASVCKFLPPVLLKLSSSQEGVRKKVMELLIHINRRLKSRPNVQLPIEALLLQYQDPAASSFVINFTIIYIKLGYPRMQMSKQAELVPSVLNALEGKPLSHQDSLLCIIMPVLGHINIPADPDKRKSMFGFQDKVYVAKQLANFMLDMLLLPYGATNQTDNQQAGQSSGASNITVPPGLSEYAFKRVIGENPPSAEQLEQTKLGIVKFILGGFFPPSDILIHLIVAASDTRFSVANIADSELKRIAGSLDWSSMHLAAPLYTLFLGTDALAPQKEVKPEMNRLPASTRIRMKLLHYLCRMTKNAFIIPPCIQVIFDSLYGSNTNPKLKSLALQFTLNIVQQCNIVPLARVASVILNGMMKLIAEGEMTHKSMAYKVIGELAQRIPSLVNKDLTLLQHFFDTLSTADGELRMTVRDALISMSSAFVFENPEEMYLTMVHHMLSFHIESAESSVRFAVVHYTATIFPKDNIPSRYLLLLASGDSKSEIHSEAARALYEGINPSLSHKGDNKAPVIPDFTEIVSYIYKKLQSRKGSASASLSDGKSLPYNIATYTEIIKYLRLCLANNAKISNLELLQHPCEFTPLIGRYLESLYAKQPEILNNYLEMIISLSHANADVISLNALMEIVGTLPACITTNYEKQLSWLYTLLASVKEDIRELAAKIYAIIVAEVPMAEFEKKIQEIVNTINGKQSLELRHGALLTLSYLMERKLVILKGTGENDRLLKWDAYSTVVKLLFQFLNDNAPFMNSSAIQGIGLIGKSFGLPLANEGEQEPNKKSVVDTLLALLSNAKTNGKLKEKITLSLGFLCIGEDFPHSKLVSEKLIDIAEETKDIDVHLSIGESLVLCVKGKSSPEARNKWKTLPEEHQVPYSTNNDELLEVILGKLLTLSDKSHPNSRQLVCVCLLILLKHNSSRKVMQNRLEAVQSVFLSFLSENNEIVQDMAAKGLCLVYDSSTEDERKVLVSALVTNLMQDRRFIQKAATATTDSKPEDSSDSKKSSSGNLLYREICSLASDINKPELVYRFMVVANNSLWTAKKSTTFDFSEISSKIEEELKGHSSVLVPKLYRYQFHPVPKIQHGMVNIWQKTVSSTSKALELYHKEILCDLNENLEHGDFRVRNSVCLALSELLKANVITNLVEVAPELWKKLFRVMDDYNEGNRQAAATSARILSQVCIRQCDLTSGKSNEQLLNAILPVLLDNGINHIVTSIRNVSIQTVSQLVKIAGVMLKPALASLIPALLNATGEAESPKLSYFSTVCSNNAEMQDNIDTLRSNVAKSHHSTDVIINCIQYLDSNILKDLMPKVTDLLKTNVGLATKVATLYFLTHLNEQLKQDLKPYSGKLMGVLVRGLTDRNTAIRKQTAVTIGHLIGSAKSTSCEKLFNTLDFRYMEFEDDSIRLAIGQTLQSINNYNQQVIKNHNDVVVPLVFFGMHAEKKPGNESTIELWTELWGEIVPGTEMGINQNLKVIVDKLATGLESASWTIKAQAANAVTTVALKLGSQITDEARNSFTTILINGLSGRTWKGKEKLLGALSILACSSKDSSNKNDELIAKAVEALHRESKKEAIEYRRYALKAFSDALHELDIDKFDEFYNIAQDIILRLSQKDDDENTAEENSKKREDKIKLQETVYQTLGKAWPNNKETQDKYSTQFVTHCNETLPNCTRPVQVAVLTTLNLFVDKLLLLKTDYAQLSDEDKNTLETICNTLYKIINYSIGISKFTRIRKESLNLILSLARKMQETHNEQQFEAISVLFKEALPDVLKDDQPEIRTRVNDIKEMFKI